MVCITPLLALGVDRLTARAPVAPVVATVLVVAAWNMGGLALALAERTDRVDSTRAELAAAAAWIRVDAGCLADDGHPSPEWAPDVTVADVRTWLDHGWYDPAPPGAGAPSACGDR